MCNEAYFEKRFSKGDVHTREHSSADVPNWRRVRSEHYLSKNMKIIDLRPCGTQYFSNMAILSFRQKLVNMRQKYGSFSTLKFSPERSIWVRMGIPASLESASGFPTKPSYYNLKMPILNIFRDFCGHLRKDSFCEHMLGEYFKIDIFKL